MTMDYREPLGGSGEPVAGWWVIATGTVRQLPCNENCPKYVLLGFPLSSP